MDITCHHVSGLRPAGDTSATLGAMERHVLEAAA
jgi:hypothetical protein